MLDWSVVLRPCGTALKNYPSPNPGNDHPGNDQSARRLQASGVSLPATGIPAAAPGSFEAGLDQHSQTDQERGEEENKTGNWGSVCIFLHFDKPAEFFRHPLVEFFPIRPVQKKADIRRTSHGEFLRNPCLPNACVPPDHSGKQDFPRVTAMSATPQRACQFSRLRYSRSAD